MYARENKKMTMQQQIGIYLPLTILAMGIVLTVMAMSRNSKMR